MKFEISFENLPAYVRICTKGKASVRGFEELMCALVHAPEWVPGTSQLVDHRQMVLTHFLPEDMQQIMNIVRNYREKLGKGRCAFVVSDRMGFGFARMYELIGGDAIHTDSNVFYSSKDADEWLKK